MAEPTAKLPEDPPEIPIKIKQEKLTPPPSPSAIIVPETIIESKETPADDKKDITPVKSSNELLDELFQAFSAVVPESLLSNPSIDVSSSSRKKHKKEKKSKKSKHKDDDPDNPNREPHKRVKVKKEKRAKSDKPDKEKKIDQPSIDPVEEPKSEVTKLKFEKPEVVKVKVEKRRIGYPDDEEDQLRRLKRVKVERSRSKERTSKSEKPREGSRVDKLKSRLGLKPTKIVIKSLKDSSVLKVAEEQSKKKSSRRQHHRHNRPGDRRHRDGNDSEHSAFSLSDEETYLIERDNYFEHDRREDRSDRNRVRSRDRSRRSSDRHDRSDHHRRPDRSENRFYASRDRFVVFHLSIFKN